MNQPLFRQEAVDHQGERLWGELILSQPVSYYVLTCFLAAITLIAILFLIFNDYRRKQNVIGYLVPDKGVVAVYPSQPGLLLELYVKEGELVKQGDNLFRIQVDQRTGGGDYISKKLIDELEAQEKTLREKIDLEKKRLASDIERHDEKIKNLTHEVNQLKELVKIQGELEAVESKSYARAKALQSQGTISRADLDKAYTTYLGQKQQFENLNLRLENTSASLAETKLEKNVLILDSEKTISDIETNLSEINKQKTRTEGDQFNVVRAPITGRVTTIIPNVGQRVDLNVPVFSILPVGSTLEAQLYVPTRAIGFIDKGQTVDIRYDAFPYQRFGVYLAQVKQVTKSVLTRAEIPVTLPINEPVYKVIASLKKQTILAYGDEISLKPGMTFSADVILDKRTLFEWLFEPLYSITGKFKIGSS